MTFTKQSGIYTLKSEQIISATLEQVWEFFTLPQNLESISPKNMKFSITNQPGFTTYLGQIITYKIGIFPLVDSNWVTEITHFKEKEFFVDEQRFGPYAMWHHEHHFEELSDKKVKMTDIINYKLPFGEIGNALMGNLIKRKIRNIFEYRASVINQLNFTNTISP